MPAQVAHHRETVLLGVLFYCVTDVADKAIRLCHLHPYLKAFLSHTHQFFLFRRSLSDDEHTGSVGIVSVEYGGDIHIDYVALFKNLVLGRNAVTHHFVNRRAHALGEPLVVERRRYRAMGNSIVVHQPVDFSRAHSCMYLFFHKVEHSGIHFSAAAYSLNLLRRLYQLPRGHKASALLIVQYLTVHLRKFRAFRHYPVSSISTHTNNNFTTKLHLSLLLPHHAFLLFSQRYNSWREIN